MLSGLIVGGKYRLRRELGQGAMGSVWAATHELLGREVAIKFLLPSLEGAETAAARFVAEAKAAARVKHRYVVDVFDFGITEDGLYYMVQELLDGVALADCMYVEPAWSLSELLRFIAQCLSGLEAVHHSGIVHRDLKPENIFVIRDAEGTHPKLLDFGISKSAESSSGRSLPPRASMRPGRPKVLTVLGTTIGTPAYMSPEQLCNASTMDGRADLYSLGVIMYEWLTGRVPFGETSNPTELYRRIHERSAPSLHALRPDLDLDLCELVDRALDPNPTLRFASASEMRAEVMRVLPAQPLVYSTVQRPSQIAPAPPARSAQPSRADADDDERVSIPGLSSSRLRGWVIGGLAAACVLLLALASWSSTRTSPVRAGPLSPRATSEKSKVVMQVEGPRPAAPVPEPTPPVVEPATLEPAAAGIVSGREPPEPAVAEAPTLVDPPGVEVAPAEVRTPDEVSVPASVQHGRARSSRPVRAARTSSARGAETRKAAVRASEPSTAANKNEKVVRTLDF